MQDFEFKRSFTYSILLHKGATQRVRLSEREGGGLDRKRKIGVERSCSQKSWYQSLRVFKSQCFMKLKFFAPLFPISVHMCKYLWCQQKTTNFMTPIIRKNEYPLFKNKSILRYVTSFKTPTCFCLDVINVCSIRGESTTVSNNETTLKRQLLCQKSK